jgi:putative addiction module component (TIGR02574 family)
MEATAMDKKNLAAILELPVEERIDIIDKIWDSIAKFPDQIRLTEAQKKELDLRDEEFERDPGKLFSLEEAKAIIRKT